MLLQRDVLASLELLLAQAKTYEQSLGTDQHTRAAFRADKPSRQLIQQVQDLESHLHPTALENLGLEPALEHLANQATRAHGVHVHLEMSRLTTRPSPPWN